MRSLLILLVRAYQCTLSRCLPPGVCRFEPTCSHYMVEALRTHGAFRGLLLGLWRILRCNPFSRGGYDPVPPARDALPDGDATTTTNATRSDT